MQEFDLYRFIELKTGVSKTDIRRVLKAAAEAVAYVLLQNQRSVLPTLGAFEIKRNKKRTRLAFYPTELFRNTLLHRKPVVIPATNEQAEKKEEQGQGFLQKLKAAGLPLTASKTDLIKSSFLQYLQKDFAYSRAWKHPLTKDTFSAEAVLQCLMLLKKTDIKSYVALYILWLKIKDRKQLLKDFGIPEQRVHLYWQRGLQKVFILLFYPELDPNILIHTAQLNADDRKQRIKRPRKSPVSNGVRRATGAYNKIFGGDTDLSAEGQTRRTRVSYWKDQGII
jgi:hypothetical protein